MKNTPTINAQLAAECIQWREVFRRQLALEADDITPAACEEHLIKWRARTEQLGRIEHEHRSCTEIRKGEKQ